MSATINVMDTITETAKPSGTPKLVVEFVILMI
jgi:hypothetical protein